MCYSIIMELSNYSKIFKALSNEQRLKIFMMIYKNCCDNAQGESEFEVGETSCCKVLGTLERAFSKVCNCTNLSKSTISHHFKELQNAGLIICEREGQTFRCRINQEVIQAIKAFLE